MRVLLFGLPSCLQYKISLLSTTWCDSLKLSLSLPEKWSFLQDKSNDITTLLHFFSKIFSVWFLPILCIQARKKILYTFSLLYVCVLCCKAFLYTSMRHILKMELIIPFHPVESPSFTLANPSQYLFLYTIHYAFIDSKLKLFAVK